MIWINFFLISKGRSVLIRSYFFSAGFRTFMWNYVATDEMHFFTVMEILQKENLKWLLDHKMTRPYTLTDGCQLKKQKI